MSRPTPGPWTCKQTGDQKAYIIGEGQSAWGTHVAEVYSDDTDGDEARANACLITAAPELLAVLRMMTDNYETEPGCICVRCVGLPKALAVISKAEGRSGSLVFPRGLSNGARMTPKARKR